MPLRSNSWFVAYKVSNADLPVSVQLFPAGRHHGGQLWMIRCGNAPAIRQLMPLQFVVCDEAATAMTPLHDNEREEHAG